MFNRHKYLPINNKTDIFWRNISCINRKVKKKFLYFLDFRSDSEQNPDPLFHETDPRIRIHIKMKRIRNTEKFDYFVICRGT